MKKYILIVLSALSLIGCRGTRAIRETPEEEITPKPNWVNERPVSSAYYIGVGSASKRAQPTDFAEAAKNNALNDLVSEISVHVQGESFLQAMDINYHFSEQFLSTITATSNEHIEGFERMGTWQDDENYYVYYRLSKATHDRIKKEMKEAVLCKALDFYQLGQSEEEKGNVVFALNNYLEGLKTLEPYWNETNEYLVNGALVHLDNLIYGSVLELANELTVQHDSQIILSSDNQFEKMVEITILSKNKKARGVYLSYDYDRGKYVRKKEIMSDQNGKVLVPVRHPNIKNKDNVLSIEVDLSNMISPELKKGMMAAVIDKIPKIQRQIPIDLILPRIFVASAEKNLDQPMNGKMLSDALKNALIKNGFSLVNSEQNTDYFIELGANTTKMGTSQGFHTSYLTFSIQMTQANSENIVYQKTESSIKGLQLNYIAAGIESYKKGVKKIKREIVPEMIEALMN